MPFESGTRTVTVLKSIVECKKMESCFSLLACMLITTSASGNSNKLGFLIPVQAVPVYKTKDDPFLSEFHS